MNPRSPEQHSNTPPADGASAADKLDEDTYSAYSMGPAAEIHAYIRCTDGTTYRLPAALQDWATTAIAAHHAHKAAGKPVMFPGQIEFGILHGTVYAELL